MAEGRQAVRLLGEPVTLREIADLAHFLATASSVTALARADL
jgi:hypothetical protein